MGKLTESHTVDLRPYLGLLLKLNIVVNDCGAGGHYGYAYFDSELVPRQKDNYNLILNNESIKSSQNLKLISCFTVATLASSIPSPIWIGSLNQSTNQVFFTSSPGVYTLTSNYNSPCVYIPPPLTFSLDFFLE